VRIQPIRIEMLVDVEPAQDVVLVRQGDVQQVADVDAAANPRISPTGSARADLDPLAGDAEVIEGEQHGSAGAAEVEHAGRT
jgi:hypothetical protein